MPGRAPLAVTFAVLTVLAALPAFAQERPATVAFAIESQPLNRALNVWAAQAGYQILVTSQREVQAVVAPTVKGTYTPEGALRALLGGSNLKYQFVADRVVTVRGPDSSSDSAAGSTTETKANEKREKSAVPLVPAQSRPREAEAVAATKTETDGTGNEATASLGEIVVTGSRIARDANNGPQEVHVYSGERLEKSGQNTVSDFLNTLPAVSVAVTNESSFQTYGGMTTVNLRGLPTGTTLTLINGRRVETAGATALYGTDMFDLNNIPLSAVERIEIVADGSSAIYGSDAIAGVVNVILKQDLQGLEAAVRYGEANGINESNASVAFGKQWSKGGFTVVSSYQKRGHLLTEERGRSADNDYRRFGSSNFNFPICPQANFFSLDGQPLPGAANGSGATYAAVTGATASGRPPLADFSYGQLNECSLFANTDLISATDRKGVFVQGRYELTPSVELFSELMYSKVKPTQAAGVGTFFGVDGFQVYSVAAGNPFNPFGVDVGVARSIPSLKSTNEIDTEFFRPLVGARGRLSDSWNWELSAWRTSDRTTVHIENYFPSAAIQGALNSTDPSTALNPFVSGPLGSDALVDSLYTDALLKFASRQESISGFVRGSALELPAGAVQVVVGSEYHKSTLEPRYIKHDFFPSGTEFQFDRDSYALFGELRIPLFSGNDRAVKRDVLTASVAGRYDHFSDFGSTTNPQFGLTWRPIESLLLRGSYGRAFKAPPLPNLYNPQAIVPSVTVFDPVKGQNAFVSVLQGGNPDLRPTRGKSHSFGAVWASDAVPGLDVSVTNWHVEERDAVQNVGTRFFVENEDLFPGRVIRDSNGNITRVIRTITNFGSIEVAGLDYQVNYSYQSASGDWRPYIAATQTYRHEAALVPGAQAVDGVSKARTSGNWSPRWKANAGLGWERGAVAASMTGRYVSRYQDYDGAREIGNF